MKPHILTLSIIASLLAVSPLRAEPAVHSVSSKAPFEGVVEIAISTSFGPDRGEPEPTKIVVKTLLYLSSAGQREESRDMKKFTLIRTSAPRVLIAFVDDTKTYMELKWPWNPTGHAPDTDPYTINKLGEESILGYMTHHLRATKTAHPEKSFELWVTKDILDYNVYNNFAADDALGKALKDAGEDGMPLKVVRKVATATQTWEVVKIEKKSLPASTFEIPSGYTLVTMQQQQQLLDALRLKKQQELDAAFQQRLLKEGKQPEP